MSSLQWLSCHISTVISIISALTESWQRKYLFIACLCEEPDRWRRLRRESRINSELKLRLFAELAVVMLRRDFVTFQRDETLLTATARTAVNLHPLSYEPASSHQWNFIS